MFISLMQDITQTRFRMCNQFREIHTVVSGMASNRSLKPVSRLLFSSQQRNNAPNNELIPLKIPHLLRCFDFLVTATYAKYVSFLGNLAPCI
jgi:hypothetical protein